MPPVRNSHSCRPRDYYDSSHHSRRSKVPDNSSLDSGRSKRSGISPLYLGRHKILSPKRINTVSSVKGNKGSLQWYVTPKKKEREFIERTAIEQARKKGFDRIAVRSNIHNTTREGPPGNKVLVECAWHYTADFYDSKTGRWFAAHVFTETEVIEPAKDNVPALLRNIGLTKGVENPEYHYAGRYGHFKPPALTDSLHYSLHIISENDEIEDGEIIEDKHIENGGIVEYY